MRTPLHTLLLREMHNFMHTCATCMLTYLLVTKPLTRPHLHTAGVGPCLLHPIVSAPASWMPAARGMRGQFSIRSQWRLQCQVRSDCSVFTLLLLGFILPNHKLSCHFYSPFQFPCYCYFG